MPPRRTQLGVRDDELLLLLGLDDLLCEELLEALAHLALAQRRHILHRLGRRGEAVDGTELDERGGTLGRVELLV
jgi:hypothetical protein